MATGTVPSEVLTRAGLIDAATEFGLSGYLKATPTLMANLHPDVILFGEDNKEEAEQETAALFRKPEYQKIAAAKAGHVYAVPGKHITTMSHLIVKAVADVRQLVNQVRQRRLRC